MAPPVIVHLPYMRLQASTNQIPRPEDPDQVATAWCWSDAAIASEGTSPFFLVYREPQGQHRHCWVFQWSTMQEVWFRLR